MKWCEDRTPVEHRDKLRVEVVFRGNSADIIDAHAPWHPEMGNEWEHVRAAKITWDPLSGRWALFALDRNDKLIHYSEEFRVPETLNGVLREIERDPTGIFWG